MYLKKQIINLHKVYGMGAKAILKELGHGSRNTIRKIINEYDFIKSSQGEEAADAYEKAKPVFHTPQRPKTKLTEHAMSVINSAIEKNKEKRKHNNRKQCVSMKKVWENLQEEGENISYQTVTRYARGCNSSESNAECFILQYHPAGEECQFDWGDVKLYIKDELMTIKMAVFCLPHSNQRRAFLFLRENTVAFLESHILYFRNISHIPKCMVYDNMRVAVSKFLGTEKTPTQALLDMSGFYEFQYRFCNPRSGNEKSYAENSVEVMRKDAFSVKDHFNSFEEASDFLMERCIYLDSHPKSSKFSNMQELIREDMNAMKPWSKDMSCHTWAKRKVSNLSLIRIESADYSVPDKYVDKEVDVKILSNALEVYDGTQLIARHEKTHRGATRMLLEHYLTTLSYKPGAVRNSVALQQAPEGVKRMFNDSFSECPKDFIEMLMFAKDNELTYENILSVYNKLKDNSMLKISFAMMKTLLVKDDSMNLQKALEVNRNLGAEIDEQSNQGLKEMMKLLDTNAC